MKEAESSANGGKISKERLLEILVENRKFTQGGSGVRNRTCSSRLVKLNNNFTIEFEELKRG